VNGTKSVVLSEGEALNDWRIDSISPQKVSLSGPAGTMTLKPNQCYRIATVGRCADLATFGRQIFGNRPFR
jgi:hypothetical protein